MLSRTEFTRIAAGVVLGVILGILLHQTSTPLLSLKGSVTDGATASTDVDARFCCKNQSSQARCAVAAEATQPGENCIPYTDEPECIQECPTTVFSASSIPPEVPCVPGSLCPSSVQVCCAGTCKLPQDCGLYCCNPANRSCMPAPATIPASYGLSTSNSRFP